MRAGSNASAIGPSAARGSSWRHTSVVPQVLANVAELSVRENVAMPMRLAGTSATEAMSTAVDIIDRLALGEQAARRPGEISVGQQQRLAVARAVAMRSTLLLADEPTSHQDAAHAGVVMAAIERAAADGAAVLVASHDPAAVNVADRIVQFDL